jgi:RNA polymerase sigma factor (sigma-70 family)
VTPSFTPQVFPALLTLRMERAGSPSRTLLEFTTALARGDDETWQNFHREFGPAIFRQLLAATRGDHDLANEALQQTYLRVARHARPCEQEDSFRSWLRIVARSALSDCRRRRNSFWQLLSRRREDPTDLRPADDSSAEEPELHEALQSALASLAPDVRALLEAKYFAGADVRSLAQDLGISNKAAESRLSRARAELRRHLHALLSRHE